MKDYSSAQHLPECRSIFKQLVGALKFMHENGVVHRDLKPTNVILTSGHEHHPTLKIIDFNSAKVFNRISKRDEAA